MEMQQLAAMFGFPVSSFPFPVKIVHLKTGNGKPETGNGNGKLPHSDGAITDIGYKQV
jgi:hypothetical protein